MSFGLGSAAAAAPTNQQDIDGGTPWVAASDGNLNLLQASLAQLQLPVTAADENGYTLLQAAASYGQISVLRWLLSSPAPANQQPQAAAAGSVVVSSMVNAVDGDGDTALHYASTVDAAKLLCEEARIDPTIRNNAGKTALQAKQEELQELMEDEDYEETDEDAVKLRSVITYLSSSESAMQQAQ